MTTFSPHEPFPPNAAVSLARLWKIAIKVSVNKLSLPKPFVALFLGALVLMVYFTFAMTLYLLPLRGL